MQSPIVPSNRDVQSRITSLVAKILGTDVDPHQPLMEAGLDSLMAMELHNSLCIEFKHDLPATLVFDFPNIFALSKYLSDELASYRHHEVITHHR